MRNSAYLYEKKEENSEPDNGLSYFKQKIPRWGKSKKTARWKHREAADDKQDTGLHILSSSGSPLFGYSEKSYHWDKNQDIVVKGMVGPNAGDNGSDSHEKPYIFIPMII